MFACWISKRPVRGSDPANPSRNTQPLDRTSGQINMMCQAAHPAGRYKEGRAGTALRQGGHRGGMPLFAVQDGTGPDRIARGRHWRRRFLLAAIPRRSHSPMVYDGREGPLQPPQMPEPVFQWAGGQNPYLLAAAIERRVPSAYRAGIHARDLAQPGNYGAPALGPGSGRPADCALPSKGLADCAGADWQKARIEF